MLESGGVEVEHGRYQTYNNYGCRCDDCRTAWADYRAQQRTQQELGPVGRPPEPNSRRVRREAAREARAGLTRQRAVEVQVDNQWHPGTLEQWQQAPDGTWRGYVWWSTGIGQRHVGWQSADRIRPAGDTP